MLIYGPPGVGKLAVGRQLAAATGFRLFHNHLTINAVSALFPRDSEPWTRLLNRMRREVFAEATRQHLDLIYTSADEPTPENLEGIRFRLAPVWAGGGSVLFVQLVCDRPELMARVQNPDRLEQDKLTDPEVLSNLLSTYDMFKALPFEPLLRIDSTRLSAGQVAAQIAEHYSLTRPGIR
ncbi:MAG TPA: shikimate kinase [Chloroflexota bacterium]|nr:shikimate kinase [Chloroflexota bacterium]